MKFSKIVTASILSLAIASSAFSSEYVCEEAYKSRVEKYEKSFAAKAGKYVLPVSTGAGTFGGMIAAAGAEVVIPFTVFGPGALIVAVGATTGAVIFDLLETGSEVIEAKAILDLAKKNELELTEDEIELALEKLVEKMNTERELRGLDQLSESEIATIRNSLSDTERQKNYFDSFVRKVNKKGKNSHYSYEEVRAMVKELGLTTTEFCPTNSKGEIKPVTYNKLVKIVKSALNNK